MEIKKILEWLQRCPLYVMIEYCAEEFVKVIREFKILFQDMKRDIKRILKG